MALAPALLQKIFEEFAAVSEQSAMFLSDVSLLAFGFYQENAVWSENDMINIEAGKFEVVEDIVVVGQGLQGCCNGLFGPGSRVRVGDALFESESCVSEGFEG